MKLSKVQTEVIKRLKAKEVCHYESGLDGRCYFKDKNISWATIFRLEDLHLVIRTGNKLVLTKQGEKL